ncbi:MULTISPECIES: MFS transporter [Crateriforma]|uniref:Enterobactin exporter EntS n=1 Tax=Crateriforma conspicua TaxID=2527996 RepID=A0A5C6FPE7_9PLAN|nr:MULTISPECIES: MFS transporter [Crateriforma]TWU63279.1 enterobactin exporter EntS [Crateriforma conspicua]
MSTSTIAPAVRISPWAPLRIRLFRAFWFASIASNLGTWIHEVGAGWLMTHLAPEPQMVAAVRTAMSLPIVFLAFPAGALADRIDRRRLLLVTQISLLLIATTLSMLTAADLISAWGLLALTFLIGLGMVLHIPTWQASVPELVPRNQLSRAVALGSISFNLARAVGPAVGGLLIASLGVWIAFAMNAASFAGVIVVLLLWQRRGTESSRGQSFALSVRHGIRYIMRKVRMRNVLASVFLFVLPASVMWSLLPLVVSQQLGWDAGGFGMLYGLIGAGAVAAAGVLPRIDHRLGRDKTVAVAMIGFALGLWCLSQAHSVTTVVPVMLLLGSCWMMTLTSLNTTAQITLPQRMRARGMGSYLTILALSMTLGSILWGFVAEQTDVAFALRTAAALMIVTAAAGLRFRLD